MRRFITSWSMSPWSRRHTAVLFLAMAAALAVLLVMAGSVGGAG